MENVCNARWMGIRNFWLHKAGYVATHVLVDSKHFLLPQTRNRGYLVAVGYLRYGASSLKITEAWASAMRGFHERPSAIIDSFLLRPDDAKLVQIGTLPWLSL